MNRRVLVVLGEPHMERALLEALRRGRYEVDLAIDRPTALRLSQRRQYAAVIIDEMIEEGSGADCFRDIERQQAALKGILCSANPTLRTIDAAVRAGMAHVVANAFAAEDVVPLLDGAVEESARLFERRFPGVSAGFETEGGVVRGGEPMWCETCNRPTSWYHKGLRRHFCCQDCLARYEYLHDCSTCGAS